MDGFGTLWMCETRQDVSLWKVVMLVSWLLLVTLQQKLSMFLHTHNIYIMLDYRCRLLKYLVCVKVLNVLNVVILTMFSHLCEFCLCFGSISDFSNSGVRAPTSEECTSCLCMGRALWSVRMVWIRTRVIFCWLFFSSIDITLIDE